MRKLSVITIAFAVSISFSKTYAQDTIPTLTIDSTLTVGDSASFGSNVRVGNKMTIDGQTLMREDVTTSSDLKVEGNLYVPNMPALTDGMTADPVFIDPEGLLLHGTIGYMRDRLYDFTPCIPGDIASPAWSNGVNKIYVECPQVKVGIATNAPTHNLTNSGDTKLNEHVWMGSSASLGADENTFSQFYMKNPSRSAALQISNEGNTASYNKLIFLEFDNSSTEILHAHNATLDFSPFLLTADGSMKVSNANGNYFDLQSSGTLIMGNSTTKTFQFGTDGLFRARRIRVDAEAWADFVFEPNYELMPLSQLETYITAHKHLPNVPSEEQALNEGIDLAEMNKVLLQKVEELTLYMIGQQKQIDALQKQMESTSGTH